MAQLVEAVQPLSKTGNGWPPPHWPATGVGHLLLLQAVPTVQAAPLATHFWFAGSQQPLPQSAPLQQASPGAPQAAQMSLLQASPEALQVAPAQQA